VRSRFHFPDGDPAFHVRAGRTTTRSENAQVIRDMLEIERERSGGAALRVRGSVEFRAEAWMQAQLMGIEVRGYRPSELERTKLARTIAQEERRTKNFSSGRAAEGPDDPDRTQAPNPGASRTPDRERGTPNEGRLYRGTLRDHGAAHYQHDRQAEMSYYVKLDTSTGERVLWGKDFERAIKQSLSSVKVGDDISVQHAGERPVTVTARRKDEQGNFVRKEEVAAYRNRWIVETRDFLREREEVARVVRDPTLDPQQAVKKHPNLKGTYVELQAARLIARDTYAHEEDRARFVARIREKLADEIERGEPYSVVRVRNPEARENAPDTTRNRKPREPRTQVQEYGRA
jgi:hypothetical protein